jgi:hypothetical protein
LDQYHKNIIKSWEGWFVTSVDLTWNDSSYP